MKARIAGYTYRADEFCPACILVEMRKNALIDYISGASVETQIRRAAADMGIDIDDAHSYDSDDFPKPIFATDINGSEMCGGCGVHNVA